MVARLCTLLCFCGFLQASSRSFAVANDSWVKDGHAVQLRSGSMHYFRVPSAYWRDRIGRLKAMGLNAISTYVAWNFHEEVEGTYTFEGDRDLVGFLNMASELDMMVLLRAGPYICGEWEFGGFPAWILNHNVTLRTYEDHYIAVVDKWWKELMNRIKPALYSNGGSVVLLQVENEFGSYGNALSNEADRLYLEHLVNITNAHLGEGSVVLYTTDGGGGDGAHIMRGSLNGSAVVSTGDGHWACASQAKYNPAGMNPCMNSETYTGWLTHWGEKMANKSGSDKGTGAALANGNSFNLYMAHGGSNFGFWSGSNGGGKGFQPDITSYDYGAPVQENGDHGFGSNGVDSFNAIKVAMQAHSNETFPEEPAQLPRKAYGKVLLTHSAAMLSEASLKTLSPHGPVSIDTPIPMESLGQSYGFIFYSAKVSKQGSVFSIADYPRDRAQVFVDDVHQGTIYRPTAAPLTLKRPAQSGASLGVLVENMGRLNFGSGIHDPKGINTAVSLDDDTAALTNWNAWTLPLAYAQVSALAFSPVSDCKGLAGPTFLRGVLEIIGEPADTYLKPLGLSKGLMWVNGFNLGRYWESEGPQHAFFAPAPYLKQGSNEVVILELEQGNDDCAVFFDDKPDWGSNVATCPQEPRKGDVLRMVSCEASMEEHQAWAVDTEDNITRLSLGTGSLCMTVGEETDVQSGQPSAQLTTCDEASGLRFDGPRIQDTHSGLCLDITAHGRAPGEPLEWYACSDHNSTNANQHFTLEETPSHLFQVVSAESGKCVSSCTQATGAISV